MNKEISNLGLSAYLMVSGFQLLQVKPSGRRSVFVFKDDGNIETESFRFFNKQVKCEPVSFWEALKTLKAMAEN
ncbi:MAG: hypothetical protein HZA77_12905 [Candidatus Schekmanbacteria bacterium]|nr:hypothetical protein [Candidatus Schekmanbacteria bacterium]